MLYIFDKDGTICQSKSGQKFINSAEDQELIPGTKEKIKQLKAKGHKIAIASNQGGVAFGYTTAFEAMKIMITAKELIDADFQRHCIYHPDGTVTGFNVNSILRKPNPGMIIEIAMALGFYNVDDIIFVGDRPEDKEAAGRAGVRFEWADSFFNR